MRDTQTDPESAAEATGNRPAHSELVRAGALDLARMISTGRVTSREVVHAHIRQALHANHALNAIVHDRFEAALDEAGLADEVLARDGAAGLGPLHGVPCTIKECLALAGMPNSSGLVRRRDLRSDTDAPVVAHIRRAGAIPLGVTNVSELCMWLETANNVYGRTSNPYNTRCMVGGSSGGEAAIVAAGGSPFGVGSDIGGSVRMPAFFNGVFAHKPSPGLVPNEGQFPIAENEARDYLCTGPLARRATDLPTLLQVMSGGRFRATTVDDVSIGGLPVVCIPDNGRRQVSPAIAMAQRRAAEALGARGAVVSWASVRTLRDAQHIWGSMMKAASGTSFGEMMTGDRPLQSTRHLLLRAVRRSPYTMPAIVFAMLEHSPLVTQRRNRHFVALGRTLRAELEHLVGDGVMLYPPFPRTAPRHYVAMASPLRFLYTAILNVVHFAATQVPTGLDANGLPTGVQVAAPGGHDARTLAVAITLERELGGWVPPQRWMG